MGDCEGFDDKQLSTGPGRKMTEVASGRRSSTLRTRALWGGRRLALVEVLVLRVLLADIGPEGGVIIVVRLPIRIDIVRYKRTGQRETPKK